MAYLGRPGATAPLTSADIPDNSITSAKIVAGTIEASDVAADMATQAELDLKAPLASPAFTGTPTGITAAHITSGALPVGVTGGTGLTGHARIGDSARSYLTSTMTNLSGETYTAGFTNDFIDNSAIFEHHADGLKVLIGGTYLATWMIYTYSNSNGSPINENYTEFLLAYKNNGSPDTQIQNTYIIYCRPHDGDTYRYDKRANANTIQLNANDVVGMRINQVGGENYQISGGSINSSTCLVLTYLSEHT